MERFLRLLRCDSRLGRLRGTLVVQKEGKKMPLEFVEISMKVGEKILTYPTGKGGEFYLENSLSTDPKSRAAADSMSCRAIAEKRKSGGNTILPGTYRAAVDYEGGKCEFDITFPETKEAITDLGEIRCVVSQASMPPHCFPRRYLSKRRRLFRRLAACC